MGEKSIDLGVRLRVCPAEGVEVVKVRGLREWLLHRPDEPGRSVLLDASVVASAISDQLNGYVPDGHFNHGLGEFWTIENDPD